MAGGMNAGTLSIEIVAEIAKLQEDMRRVQQSVGRMSGEVGRSTKAVNDNFRSVGRSAEQAAADIAAYGRSMDQLRAKYNPQFAAISQYKAALADIRQAHKLGAISSDEMAAAITRERQATLASLGAHRAAAGGVVQATTAQRQGMQQLGYQLGDISTMYAMGAKPAQIFASQIGQVTQAVQLMSGGTSKFAAFLGGPWGIALSVAVLALGPLIAKLLETEDAADGALAAVARVRKARLEDEKEARTLTDMSSAYNAQLRERDAIEARIASRPKDANGNPMFSYKDIKDLKALNKELGEASKDISYQLAQKSPLEDALRSKEPKAVREKKPRAEKLSDIERATLRQAKATDTFVESLEQEIAKIGLDEKAIRQLEIARQMEAASTDKQRGKIIDLSKAREAALAHQEAVKAAEANQDFAKKNTQLERELQLIGMVGGARERAALALSEQAEIEAVLVELQKAEAAGNTELVAQLQERIRLIKQKYAVEQKGVGLTEAFERELDAAERLNAELDQMIGLLGNLNGFGRGLGTIMGILTGRTSAIGGPLGDLFSTVIGTKPELDAKGKETGKEIAKTIGDEVADVFQTNGPFAQMMQSVLGGAGIGAMVGNIMGGNTGSKIGSIIGAVAGKEFMAAAAGPLALASEANKMIGDIFGFKGGPLGIFTGLLTSVKWGRVNLSQQGASATQGNSGASERAAAKAGGSFMGGLNDIADAFGGAVGDFGSISLGVRHGDWRVNAGGTSLKKKNGAMDFNEDAEAAIAYALQIAIERGAITGIREGTQRLLNATDDLSANLEKALAFEGVFKELEQRTDPLGFALDALTREFDRLKKIFDEAGATAAEYASLEQLLALKRSEAIEDMSRQKIDDMADKTGLQVEILQLLGKEQDALALSRIHELAATKAALQPLQAMVYQLRDARDVIEQFQPLADGLKAFKQELLGGSTQGGFASVASQFRATAGMARNGNADALGKLQGDAGAFLEAARANAASELEYRRALGEVLAATDQGIFAAETQVDYAQLQIDAINNSATILADIKEEMATYRANITQHNEWMERQMRRFDGEGIPIRSDATTPVYTQAVA